MIINVPQNVRIAVVGDIHAHPEQFNSSIKYIKPSQDIWYISVGDIVEKGFGEEASNKIIDTIKDLSEKNCAMAVKGNHDIKYFKKAKKDKKTTKQSKWLEQLPLSISFRFCNGSRLLVVHAGVLPKHTESDLDNCADLCYIREVDPEGEYVPYIYITEDGKKIMKPARSGVKWHEIYDGRFGYTASGHDSNKDGIPKFYNFSCNLDAAVYCTGRLTVQIFSEKGKEDLLFFDGEPRFKDASDFYKSMAVDEIK